MHEKKAIFGYFFLSSEKSSRKNEKKSLSKKMHFYTSDFENYHLRKKNNNKN